MKRSIQPGIATGASLLTAALLIALVTPAAFAVDADPAAPNAVATSAPADTAAAAAADAASAAAVPTDAASSGPASVVPATDPAATESPATESPATDAPAADAPTTDAPAADMVPADPGTAAQQAIVGSGAGLNNGSPTPQDDVYQVQEDQDFFVLAPGVLANDTDPDNDAFTVIDDTTPAHGLFDISQDGKFVYQPNPGFLGTDTATYLVSDGISAPASATITFNVVFDPAVNHAPVVVKDLYTTPVDTPLVVAAPGIFANDHDADGDTITLSSITATTQHGSLVVNNDGSFTYTPEAGYYGDDQFQYRATDGTELSTSTTLVNIQVGGPFSDPIAADDHYSVAPGTMFTTSAPGFVANDTQDGKPVASVALTFPQWVQHGTLDIHVDGSLSYTPDPGFTGTDTVQYRVGGYGQLYSNVATITFTVGNAGQGGGDGGSGGGSGGGTGTGCAPTAPCPPSADPCTDAAGVPVPGCGTGGGSHLSHLALTGTTPTPYLAAALLLGLAGVSVLVAHSVRRRSVARRVEMGR
jgi:hypothetical protein